MLVVVASLSGKLGLLVVVAKNTGAIAIAVLVCVRDVVVVVLLAVVVHIGFCLAPSLGQALVPRPPARS